MQGDAAHHLDVEGAHAQNAPRRLAHGREGLDQEVVQGFPLLQAILELLCFGLQLLVRQCLEVLLHGVHLRGQPIQLAQHPAFARAKDLVNNRHEKLLTSCARPLVSGQSNPPISLRTNRPK